MKKFCWIATFALLFGPVLLAGAAPVQNSPWRYYEFDDAHPGILDALTRSGAIIDHDRRHVWLTEEQLRQKTTRGWEFREVSEPISEVWPGIESAAARSGNARAAYHTFDEMEAALQSYAAQYPDLCRLESIGKSVENRDLWFLKITDNPDTEEAEPEVKYISSMHGDEILGMEVMLDLIDRLLTDYGTDPRITSFVDETEIWIMPLMNPDGWMASPPRRFNANNVDLNRDFPSYRCGNANTTTGREPETAAVMDFSAGRNFVVSANFHGGALVANYPFDECTACNTQCETSDSTENDEFVDLALAYSVSHGRMFDDGLFPQGITNGAAWYSVYGGMQDWNYWWMGDLDLTLELDSQKTPSLDRLDGLIAENREPALAYLEWVHRGIRGLVTDAGGNPVPATIRVTGTDLAVSPDPDVGDYYRLLMPGTYDLMVEAQGYDPMLIEGVVVSDGPATIVNLVFGESARQGDNWILY